MKTRLSAAVLAALVLAGCALPVPGTTPGVTPSGNVTKPGDRAPIVDPKTGKPVPNQPLAPIDGLEFKPLTQGAAQYLSQNGGGIIAAGAGNAVGASAPMAAAAPASAPMAKAAGGAMAADAAMVSEESARSSSGGGSAGGPGQPGGAFSGNVWSPYSFGYYFGGFGGGGSDQMALYSVQEATAKGYAGSFQGVIADLVGPLVRGWAGDARLTQTGAVLTNDGKVFVEPRTEANKDMMIRPGYGGPFGEGNGWRLVYTSTALNEIMIFTVTAEKTVVLRMAWKPLDLEPERVTVDSGDAVKKLIAAISDKGFQGEEEKTMKDYFMGYPFEQPKTGEWDSPDNKTEVIYEVPKNARWNVNLQKVMGKIVWELNWWAQDEERAYPMKGGTAVGMPTIAVARAPMIDEGTEEGQIPECGEAQRVENSYTNWNGQGMVDAETGAVIRFTRPTKNTYWYFNGPDYLCRKPEPKPAVTPEPTPSATPSTEPSDLPTDDGTASDAEATAEE